MCMDVGFLFCVGESSPVFEDALRAIEVSLEQNEAGHKSIGMSQVV